MTGMQPVTAVPRTQIISCQAFGLAMAWFLTSWSMVLKLYLSFTMSWRMVQSFNMALSLRHTALPWFDWSATLMTTFTGHGKRSTTWCLSMCTGHCHARSRTTKYNTYTPLPVSRVFRAHSGLPQIIHVWWKSLCFHKINVHLEAPKDSNLFGGGNWGYPLTISSHWYYFCICTICCTRSHQ